MGRRSLFLTAVFAIIAAALPCATIRAQADSDPLEVSIPDGEQLPSTDSGSAAETGIKPFGEALAAAWPAISGGRPQVRWADLVEKMNDSSIKGENAAVLDTLIFHLRKVKDTPLSLQDAQSLPGEATSKGAKSYAKMALKLKNLDRTLFIHGKPTFELMQQGPATDCYFFSGTGWIAKNRPEAIVAAIRVKPGNRYLVRFPDGEEVELETPTDAEIAYNDSPSTLSDGIWMSVLVKAEGIIEAGKSEKRAAIADPSLRVDIGGGPMAIVRRWTGGEASGYQLGDRANRRKVRAALERLHRDSLMGEALTPKHPDGKIIGNHCYAILDFDPKTEMLTLWNPWGNDFTPKDGQDGPGNGYTRKKGIFMMPLADFISMYKYMAIAK